MEGNSQKRPRVEIVQATPSPPPTPVEQIQSSCPPKSSKKYSASKRQWTKKEDCVLVDCLVELTKDPAWKAENGFRTGYLQHLERVLATKLPLSNLKATPHIESRYKLLKRQFHAINEMVNHSSGFGWNDRDKCITATKDVFDDWVKSHPSAVGLRNKEFPHFDDLMFVWGKDHAIGAGAETPADAVEAINLCDEEANVLEEPLKETWGDGTGQEEEDSVREETRNIETPTPDASATEPSKKPVTSKKRGKSDDVLNDLVGEIHEYVAVVKETNEELKGIFSYFKNQTESHCQRMKIFDEIMELSGFSEQEIIDVGEYILKDAHKVDTFFTLPKAFRRNYVAKQLSNANF